MWGQTGWRRMFDAEIGGQVAWLLPAALVLLAAGLWLTRRAPRTDRARAALLLWGGWLVVTGLVFSFMQGIFHAYYTVALAPAIGALVGIGAAAPVAAAARRWRALVARRVVAVTAVWSYVLLRRSADWLPWLRAVRARLAVARRRGRAASLAVRLGRSGAGGGRGRAAGAGLLVALAGPAAYSLDTAATAAHRRDPVGRAGRSPARGGPGGGSRRRSAASQGGGRAALPGSAAAGRPSGGRAGAPGRQAPGGAGGPGGLGGLLDGGTPTPSWSRCSARTPAPTPGSRRRSAPTTAAGYQLATGEPVMAIGGFNGSDPPPTLAQFQQYVAEGKIHYFLGGGGMGGRSMGGSDTSRQISAWVADNFTATSVGGATVYDLTAG